MFRRPGFLLCAFPALSAVLLASGGETSAVSVNSLTHEPANERGVPALFSLADFDGDGRLDLAAVSGDGTLQLLANAGEGRFEDVTERVGLSAVKNAALALWADYDGDGRIDLFVGAREGASRLFHNEHGAFVDMSAGSGLASEGAVQSAQWLDLDGDGRLDLFVVSADGSELFRGIEGGFFERQELPLAGAASAPLQGGSIVSTTGGDSAKGTSGASRSPGENGGARPGRSTGGMMSLGGANASGSLGVRGPTTSSPTLPLVAIPGCIDSIDDHASPGTCLEASTAPTLGRLYPISANLFVATGGNVGIGTTSPAAKLDVAGATRIIGTLTLSGALDQAVDVTFGSIYKNGALFIHTRGGIANTALGRLALSNVTSGFDNTASGYRALFTNTTGGSNTASGDRALYANTSGDDNTAIGMQALDSNTSGFRNTALGSEALSANTLGKYNTASGFVALSNTTTGGGNTASGSGGLELNTTGSYNMAIGFQALVANTTGSRNIAVGAYAGRALTTGNDNIAIGNPGVAGESATIRVGISGTQTRAFVAGIRGVTTANANAIPVVVDSAGQLGTVSSSRRFKKDIADMGERTERLLELRPVVFHYKQEQKLPDGAPNGGEVPLEYGLIAEEVAEIFPDLVVYDDEGKPFTVKYHILSSMLLNELKKEHAQLAAQSERLQGLEERLVSIESRTAELPAAPMTNSR